MLPLRAKGNRAVIPAVVRTAVWALWIAGSGLVRWRRAAPGVRVEQAGDARAGGWFAAVSSTAARWTMPAASQPVGRPLREGRDVAPVSELAHAQLHRRPGTVEDARQLLREWRELTREL